METAAGSEDAVELLGRSPCTGAGGREGAWAAVGGLFDDGGGGGDGGNAHRSGFRGSSDGDSDAERAPPHLERTRPPVPVSASPYSRPAQRRAVLEVQARRCYPRRAPAAWSPRPHNAPPMTPRRTRTKRRGVGGRTRWKVTAAEGWGEACGRTWRQ